MQDGRITEYGQTGGGRVSSTLVQLAGMRVQVEAVVYPELRPEPSVRAVTDCRVVSYHAADLLAQDLRELATGHYREGR